MMNCLLMNHKLRSLITSNAKIWFEWFLLYFLLEKCYEFSALKCLLKRQVISLEYLTCKLLEITNIGWITNISPAKILVFILPIYSYIFDIFVRLLHLLPWQFRWKNEQFRWKKNEISTKTFSWNFFKFFFSFYVLPTKVHAFFQDKKQLQIIPATQIREWEKGSFWCFFKRSLIGLLTFQQLYTKQCKNLSISFGNRNSQLSSFY